MKKSIGGKIYSVLGIIFVVFFVVVFLNGSATMSIKDNNDTLNTYLEMQQIKGEVSTAFQQVQLYTNLTYFKKDKADEKELMQTKLADSMEAMNTNMEALGELCAQVNDEQLNAAYSTWKDTMVPFTEYVEAILADAKANDYNAVQSRVDNLKAQKDPVQAAEEAYDEIVVQEQRTIMDTSATEIEQVTIENGIALAVAVVLVVVAFVIVNFTIAKPAKNSGAFLKSIVTKLENNEGDLTERIPVKTSDEIGQMAVGINGFMEQLQSLLRTIKDGSDSMKVAVEKTRDGVVQSNEDATSVSAAMEQMSASMEEISATLESIVCGTLQVTEDVDNVGKQVNDGVGLVAEIRGRANKMHKDTLDSKDVTSEKLAVIRSELVEAVEASRSVEKIKELTAEILNIASQTNLLSLNASIEAARAGEAGRGFAVVADEIRSLADDSTNTASNIQTISDMVTNAVDKLSAHAEQMVEFVDGKVMQDYDGFVEVVQQYKQDAESVNTILSDISDNTERINEIMQAMNTGINDIAIAVDESAKGVVMVAENAVSLASQMVQIQNETEVNQEISEQLVNEVKRFKNI